MSADRLLELLDGVRQTGPGRWVSLCPSHEDRHASLSVRELEDGRVLVHDFAGCSVYEIVAAVGLDLSDLFPPSESHTAKRERRPFPAADVLRAVSFEALVAGIMLGRLSASHALMEDDRLRGLLACERLIAAADLALPPSDRRRAHLEARRIAGTSLEERVHEP